MSLWHVQAGAQIVSGGDSICFDMQLFGRYNMASSWKSQWQFYLLLSIPIPCFAARPSVSGLSMSL